MLVLTRKQQEKIQIGDDIVITVLKTKGKTVRIGIEAPSTMPVLRGELAVRIREEEEAKSMSSGKACASTKSKVTGESFDESPKTGSDWNTTGNSPQVSLERVSRSRVATVLSEKLGGSMTDGRGPLRAMLDRRAGAAL